MTAAEAKELTEKSIPEVKEFEFNELLGTIKHYAGCGSYNLSPYKLSESKNREDFIERLKALGYKIAIDKGSVTISWE